MKKAEWIGLLVMIGIVVLVIVFTQVACHGGCADPRDTISADY